MAARRLLLILLAATCVLVFIALNTHRYSGVMDYKPGTTRQHVRIKRDCSACVTADSIRHSKGAKTWRIGL